MGLGETVSVVSAWVPERCAPGLEKAGEKGKQGVLSLSLSRKIEGWIAGGWSLKSLLRLIQHQWQILDPPFITIHRHWEEKWTFLDARSFKQALACMPLLRHLPAC